VLVGGGEDQEGLLFDAHHNLRLAGGVVALEVVDFALSEDEGLGLDRPLLEGDPSCHVFYVLDDEIHRHSVVSETRNDDVSVDCSGQDEVSEGFFDEFVVLFKNADDAPASFGGIALQATAEPNIV